MTTNRLILIMATVLILPAVGCESDDQVARVATQAADRQAQQNIQQVQLHREVAAGTKKLVEADAQARKDLIAAQQHLQVQQAEVGRNRDQLEVERQAIAQQRQTVSLWTPLLQGLGIVLVAALALGLCWCLLFGLRSDDNGSQELSELLVMELAAEEPRVLLGSQSATGALPPPDETFPDGAADTSSPEPYGPDSQL
ncbi:MAG: hypothetical protein K8T91_18795 [Planctomycetes bacterium]|nr:hypothetical protein [Planctomycetota bacterium]